MLHILNTKKAQQKLIKKIHNEFDTAQERLLAEAKHIIQTADLDKAKRLMHLGFNNASPVRHYQQKVGTSVQDAQQIEYYMQKYPQYKYISEAELDRICKKYGLVYAPINCYTGDVPLKNVKEIENALLGKTDDFDVVEYYVKYDGEFLSACPKEIKEKLKSGVLMNRPPSILVQSQDVEKQYGYPINEYCRYTAVDWVTVKVEKSGFFIAATPDLFDKRKLKELKKQTSFGYFKTTVKDDPIVFRYVKGGGVLIISKWGIEGEDEALVNEKMN